MFVPRFRFSIIFVRSHVDTGVIVISLNNRRSVQKYEDIQIITVRLKEQFGFMVKGGDGRRYVAGW